MASDYVTTDDLQRAKAHELGVPFVNLKDHVFDPKVLRLIPEPICREYNVVAFGKQAQSLEVALLDMDALDQLDWLPAKTGLKIVPRLTDDKSIKAGLIAYQQWLQAEFGEQLKKNLSPAEALEALIAHATTQQASDIHLEPNQDHFIVHYRLNGHLRQAMILAKALTAKILNELESRSADERYTYHVGGEKIVINLRPQSTKGFSLEALGMKASDVDVVHRVLRQRQGLVLIVGKAGAGKTTTLYTILDLLNRPEVNIVTVEDPIEYQLPRINQTAVDREIGLTMVDILKNIGKQDPDIIAIGEIADSATGQVACQLGLTGRLVLATVQADSATAAIKDLVASGVDSTWLDKALKLVISQTLVPEPTFEVLTAAELY